MCRSYLEGLQGSLCCMFISGKGREGPEGRVAGTGDCQLSCSGAPVVICQPRGMEADHANPALFSVSF